MFSHLFNTYEAVTPPPKSNKDFRQEIYQEPEDNMEILSQLNLDLLNLDLTSEMPYVEKPSDKPFMPETDDDFMSEETQNYQTSNRLINNIINTT